MDHPKYLRFFSTGDLLTLGAAVVAVAMAWGSMTNQMQAQAVQIRELQAQIEGLRRESPDARLRVLERRADDADQWKQEMRADLREVNRKLDTVLERLPKR